MHETSRGHGQRQRRFVLQPSLHMQAGKISVRLEAMQKHARRVADTGNANGVSSSSPGLERSMSDYPGNGSSSDPTPTGLRPVAASRRSTTPFGVDSDSFGSCLSGLLTKRGQVKWWAGWQTGISDNSPTLQRWEPHALKRRK